MNIKLRLIFLPLILLYGIQHLSGQHQDIGSVEFWKRDTSGISGKTARAYFTIRVYDANTIRVRISANQVVNEFSYLLAETAIPQQCQVSVSESETMIFLNTEMIHAEIEKTPRFRMIFKTPEGRVINEDVPGEGFGTCYNGNRTNLYKVLQVGERFVGLGEVLGNLDKRGAGFTLNNTDTYKYGDPRLPMYTNVPFYIGIHHNLLYGLFYHNTYKSFFNFGLSTPAFTSITADGGDIDYFFIHCNSMAGILESYTRLTGRMPLPPFWSLGYHQSRCSYYPQGNVELLAETFRKKQIPVDCIVLDADYLQDYEPFRINMHRFPDLKGLTGKLKSMGIEVTASVNPGIKLDSTYFAHWDGLAHDVFLRHMDGSLYTAEIAPSLNHFVDFTKPASRKWWSEHMKFLPDHGIHGYWNDMNEPAVGGSYLPDNLLFDFDGRKADALEAKNVYGMLMARSSFESALEYGNGRRPFILTRSGFAGVQRYAAVWTGDNTAKDEFLLGGTLLNTQMGLSGIPFVGDDIGGYIGTTSKELFTRWMQVGMFAPYARNHKEAYAHANEPWSFGEEAEAISKEFIGFRYRLLPYLYSKFYETSTKGIPVARSLCIDAPFDSKVYDGMYQYQFLCGDALLVIPVTSSERTKDIYLPEGDWYSIYTDEKFTGPKEMNLETRLHQIPVFVKASSVIPMQSLVQYSGEKPTDTLILHVYYGSGRKLFTYYEDDGNSFQYREGHFCIREIDFDPGTSQLKISSQQGDYKSKFSILRIVLHGFPESMNKLQINGRMHVLQDSREQLINGLRYLKDIYDPKYLGSLMMESPVPVSKATWFPFGQDMIRISW